MKKFISFLIALAIVNLMFTACEKQDEGTPPELPPLESMNIDFDGLKVDAPTKAAETDLKSAEETMVNYTYAVVNVGVFNLILAAVIVVPVTAFANAFNYQPVYKGNASWEWTYSVNGFANSYTARLTGQIRSEDILWEMYLTKAGVGAHPEFLWFSGTSDLDGNGGQWILNHSYQYPDPFLQIDWEKTGTEIGEIKYTIIRELNNEGSDNPNYGSYVHAGIIDADYNAFYTVHLPQKDVFIEWSTTDYYGRVKDELNLAPGWHCWNNFGYDIDCSQ